MEGVSVVHRRPSWSWREVELIDQPQSQALDSGPGDHHGVVCAEPHRGRQQHEALRFGDLRQSRPDGTVRRDATGDDQHVCIRCALAHHRHRVPGAIGQHLGHRALKAGCDVRRHLRAQRASPVARDLMRHGGLQTGEAEVAAAASPAVGVGRQSVGRLPPAARRLQRWSAGPAKPQQLRHLVERLAGGIVHRAAEPHVLPDALDRDALAVAAGHQQQQIGERHPALHQPGRRAVRACASRWFTAT